MVFPEYPSGYYTFQCLLTTHPCAGEPLFGHVGINRLGGYRAHGFQLVKGAAYMDLLYKYR